MSLTEETALDTFPARDRGGLTLVKASLVVCIDLRLANGSIGQKIGIIQLLIDLISSGLLRITPCRMINVELARRKQRRLEGLLALWHLQTTAMATISSSQSVLYAFSTTLIFSLTIPGFRVLLQSILAAADRKAVQETEILLSHVALRNSAIGRSAHH